MHVGQFILSQNTIRSTFLTCSSCSSSSMNEQFHFGWKIEMYHILLYSSIRRKFTSKGISIPLAARSVTMRKLTLFCLNSCNLSSLDLWSIAPYIKVDLNPATEHISFKYSTWYLVAPNMIDYYFSLSISSCMM